MGNIFNTLWRIPGFFIEFALDLLFASCHGFQLPRCFADWVDRNMPNLGGVSSVTLCCCHRGDLPFGPVVNSDQEHGLTVGEHVALAEDRCPFDPCNVAKVQTLLHELTHVEQYRTVPGFTIRYMIEIAQAKIRHGLSANSDLYNKYEKDARRRARELLKKYIADNPCGCEDLSETETEPGEQAQSSGTAPQLSAAEVAARRAAGRCDRPTITSQTTHPGGETQVIVRAASTCGIQRLHLELALLSAGGGQASALPPVEQHGGCPEFRVATVRRALAPGAFLQIDVTAESCIGETGTRRIVVAPP